MTGRRPTGLLAALLLGGCISPVVLSETGTLEGVPYSLPMTMIEVSLEVKEEGAGKPAPPAPVASAETLKTERTETTEKKVTEAGKEVTDKTTLKTDLTRTRQDGGGAADGPWAVVLKVTLRRVPDPGARYVLRHDDADFHSETLQIGVTEEGFLSLVSSESTDRTPEVAKVVVGTAANVVTFQAIQSQLSTGKGGAGVRDLLTMNRVLPEDMEFRIAEADGALREGARASLASIRGNHAMATEARAAASDSGWEMPVLAGGYLVRVRAVPCEGAAPGIPLGRSPEDPVGGGGVRARAPEAYTVTASLVYRFRQRVLLAEPCTTCRSCRAGLLCHRAEEIAGEAVLSEVTVPALLPDFSPTYTLRLDRVPFVTAKYGVEFKGGTLSKATVDRPSPALGIATLPFDITSGLLDLPTKILQLKFDIASKEAALLAKERELAATPSADAVERDRLMAEKARIQAELDLLKARKDLEDFKAKNPGLDE